MALVVMLLTACGAGDRLAPHGSVHRQSSGALIVSAPLSESGELSRAATAASPALKSSAAPGVDSVVYVSLPPGSVAGGDNATIHNVATGQVRPVPMLDGGFDPTPLAATVGDTLDVEVHRGATVIAAMIAIVPPHHPPTIVRTDPPKGQTDVPLNTQIGIVFSEPVEPATVARALRLLNGSTPIAGTASLSETGIVGIFAPDSPLAPRSSYELDVDTSVRDSRGEPLDSAVHVPFTTGQSFTTAAASLTIAGLPTSVLQGQPAAYTVSVKDAAGNTVSGYGGTVHFTSTDPSAQLPPDYTFVGGDRGSHTFAATLETSGNQTVSVIDASTNSIRGSANVSVIVALPGGVTSPEYFDFGFQTIDGVSTPKRVAVMNNGSSPLSISSLGMTDLDWQDFQQTNDCPSVLPAGASCTVTVTFRPTATGSRVGQLMLNQIWGVSMSGASTPALSVAIASDSTGQSGRFLYVANAASNDVATYGINPDGTLTSRGTVSAGTAPSALAVDPRGSFVYVANFASNDVSAFAIGPDGTLLSRGRSAAGPGPVSVAVAPDPTGRFGRFLYVANSGGNEGAIPTPSTVSMYRINGVTGALTPLVPASVDAGIAPWSVSVHPSGRFAYVANGGYFRGDFYSGTTVEAYTVDPSSGILTELPPGSTIGVETAPFSPTSVVFDRSGTLAIMATGHGAATFSVNAATGTLAFTGNLSNNLVNATAAAFHPSGRFAYATSAFDRCCGESNVIRAYAIGSDGVYTPAASPSLPTGLSPTSIAMDPSGKFVYVANSGSKSISVYAVDSTTGTLTLVATVGV